MKKFAKIMVTVLLVATIVGACFAFTACNDGDADTITVYTESGFAPYEFIYEGKVVGLDMAIMAQAAENLGKKLNIQDVAFDTIPTLVQTATGDAVGAAGMSITAERLEAVDFSNVYSSSTLVVVSANGEYDSVADLAGKKVGVQEGTSGDLIISAAKEAAGYTYDTVDADENPIEVTVNAEGATVSQYKQYALAFADLKNGKIDAILMDKIPAQLMLTGETGYAAVDATDLLQEDFGIAITKGNDELKAAVNAVIDEWNANGKMAQYMDYYSALAEVEEGGEVPTAPEGLKIEWNV